MFTHFFTDTILFSVWHIYEFYGLIIIFLNDFFDFVKRHIKKFSAQIYHVKFFVFKSVM